MARYGGNSGGGLGGNSGGNRGDSGGNRGEQLIFPRDHADSPASPLLSEALVGTRDAITGYWAGDITVGRTATDLQDELEDNYLDKIRLPYQALVLECLLKGRITVTGRRGSATLLADGKPVTTIRRPSPDYFGESLFWIRAYADLRDDRLAEIHVQLDDMLSFFGALAHLDAGRRKYTLLMLDLARSLAIHVETPMKFLCPAVRPNEYAMEVQPMIQTPDYSTYPSGHAMEAFAIATVLHRLSTGQGPGQGVRKQALPFRLAHRVAANRTVAGVHFPVDSLAGAWVGCKVGELIYAFAEKGEAAEKDLPKPRLTKQPEENGADGPVCKTRWQRPEDFLLSNFLTYFEGPDTATHPIGKIDIAHEMWGRAKKEWLRVQTLAEDCSDG